MFAAVFMATDPVSAAKTKPGKLIYGAGIGILGIVLRGYSNFSCGMMFAILIFNMFAPLIDAGVKQVKASRKNRQKETADAGA
jgi:Na+-transporting NADH:ubiquinone oxidoreductase subunit B